MAFAKKHFYKPGSPGAAREQNAITLSAIKKVIKSSINKTAARRSYRERGLLVIG